MWEKEFIYKYWKSNIVFVNDLMDKDKKSMISVLSAFLKQKNIEN